MREKKKTLIMDFLPNGEILIETDGFKGKMCETEAMKFLEAAYNKDFKTKDFKEKAEWWLRNGRQVRKARERGVKIENHCG